MIRGSKTVSDTVLKHDLCELVIAEVRFAITNDGMEGSKPSKERFQEFAKNSGVIGGERFRFDPFRQAVDGHNVTRFDQVVGITVDCGPIESRVKHFFGGVVRAMVSPGGSIVASLENVIGFLAVNRPPDDLILTDFEQEGVVPKDENPSKQSRLGIFLSKEIFEGGMIRIHNAFVHDENHTYGKVACIAHKLKGRMGYLSQEDGSSVGYLRKALYESSIEASMTKKATDTIDGSGMRQRLVSSHGFSIFSKWERQVAKEFLKAEKSSLNTSIVFRSYREI
uniref:Uncharacterized protein n=1 Tax=Tanacetum cinerariifolium TaxID=118510 RepID=A0A6L2P520_TANCI|nr:hypothetical protein [Tanacetum cinerariifolium]